MDRWTDEWTDEWTNEWTNEWISGPNERMTAYAARVDITRGPWVAASVDRLTKRAAGVVVQV